MSPSTGTLLIVRDIAVAWDRLQVEELARLLASQLHQPTACHFPEDSLADGIQKLADQGVRRLILLPLGLLPVSDHGSLRQTVSWAQRRWPGLECLRAPPLTWREWARWLNRVAIEAAHEQKTVYDPEEIAVLVIGRAAPDPLTNADLARLAHLLREPGLWKSVAYGLIGSETASPGQAIDTLIDRRPRHIVVAPWLVSQEEVQSALGPELDRAVQSHGIEVTVAKPNLCRRSLINLLVANQLSATPFPSNSPRSATGESDGSTGLSSEAAYELEDLERRINEMLPGEYQGRYEEVSPRSMGSAGLKYDSEGKVAWDEIWTSFCDLALAGGPPHRGTLLEAVTSDAALAEPEQYQAVVAEIERGIGLVTSLPLVASRTPGWVGVRCDSEEMAAWLMRAIIVENVMVRREGDVLYLPAGPKFTVKREIKNVITSVAKTVHYWQAHLINRRMQS
ncbi:MAG: hypothetical protein U0872_16310 [Planctomycetaceae bacterium]